MSVVTIRHRNTGATLYEGDHDCLRSALVEASRKRAYLVGADLRGADLRGADLRWADLRWADLHGADLCGADLRGADLRGAYLGEPGSLRISWSSHALVSEILWRAAGDTEPRQMLAAYVGRRDDWCWEQWSTWEHPEREWALRELARWVHADDTEDDVPEIVWSVRGVPNGVVEAALREVRR